MSWTTQKKIRYTAHQKNPQESNAPSQERITTLSFSCSSLRCCWRRSDSNLYRCKAVLIAHPSFRTHWVCRICETEQPIWQTTRSRLERTPHQLFDPFPRPC